jgi:hypothetical protein
MRCRAQRKQAYIFKSVTVCTVLVGSSPEPLNRYWLRKHSIKLANMPTQITGIALTPLWLLYGVLSSACLYVVKVRRPSLLLWFAAFFAVIDTCFPFSYPSPDRILEIAPTQFVLALMRPAKMLMLAFGQGFLAREMSLKQHIVLCMLPVVPLKALPEHVQKRIPAFRASASTWMQLSICLVTLLGAATAVCCLDPATTSYLARSAIHLVAFVAFMHILLLGAALLATALGSEAIVNPFNSFWQAESVADWWSYRWNAVIGTSLRCTVYDPIVKSFKARNPGMPVPQHVKLLAGCATFAYSALIHEQSLVNQHAFAAAGPLTLFFMLQPALIVLQPWLTDAAAAALLSIKKINSKEEPQDSSGIKQNSNGKKMNGGLRRLAGRLTTACLLGVSILLLWCPAYEPPYSDVTVRISTASMKLLPGMLDAVPYCS